MDVVDLRGFEKLAVQKLSPAAYAYFAGGSGDESTLRDNEAAFSRRVLRGGSPVDIAEVDLSTSMLGMRVAMPIALAPVALQGLAHKDGELVPARVAARLNVVACLSTLSSQSLESVSTVGGTRWFQLYELRDRRISEQLVERAVVSGYRAIVLTVDLPVVGVRERELREPLHLKGELGNLTGFPESDFRSGIGEVIDPSLSWTDLAWVRSLSGLPLVLKGILDPVDAEMAVEHGVDAIEGLTRRITAGVAGHPLLGLPGAGAITVARLIAEVGDVRRFRTADALAALAGVAPIPASSGQVQRMRLNRGGNRQLNRALHVIAVSQARFHPEAKAYVTRRIEVDGKTWREAIRALKRRLVRPVHLGSSAGQDADHQ